MRPNVALVASNAPNATLGALDAPNATLGRLGTATPNPILLPGSPERRVVEASGMEVAMDGLEVEV